MAEPQRGKANLDKQMREIERLRAEMGAQPVTERACHASQTLRNGV